MIVFGDGAGGVLLFTYMIVYGAATYAPDVIAAIAKQRLSEMQSQHP